ncbi:MAG: hypothetical protein AAF693_13655 [Bacteroidota bacterium]
MKRILASVIALVLISGYNVFSQNKQTEEKIQAARIALITERLSLTPEQAEKFWPLYNEFSQKRKELREEYNAEKGKLNMETATEEQKRALLNFGLKLKERNLTLERTYSDRMLSIISSDQILSLTKAEEDFRKMVLQQIQKRRQQQQDRRNQFRDRANDRQQQRRNN